MVKPDSGDARDNGMRRSRRVPAAPETDLEHSHVDASLGEHDERRHGKKVELGHPIGLLAGSGSTSVHSAARLGGHGDAARERLALDRLSRDLHTLAHLHELGRRVERALLALAGKNGRCEARSGGLAVGARYLDDVESRVGSTELVEHLHDGFEQGVVGVAEEPAVVGHGGGLVV